MPRGHALARRWSLGDVSCHGEVRPIVGTAQHGTSRRAYVHVLDHDRLARGKRLDGAALKVGTKVRSDKKGSQKSAGDWAGAGKHGWTNGKLGEDKHEDVSLVRNDPI